VCHFTAAAGCLLGASAAAAQTSPQGLFSRPVVADDMLITGERRVPRSAQSAAAPTSGRRRWEVEVHGGRLAVRGSSGGTAALPPPGASFTTNLGLSSRRVSSWYFGDGAAFFNELPAGVRGGETMTALDPALHVLADRRSGASLGGRVAYALAERLSVELTVEYGAGGAGVEDGVLAQVEETRASFIDAWTAATTRYTAPRVSSEVSIRNGPGRELLAIGGIVRKLGQARRVQPFVTAGAGISSAHDPPAVTLSGRYSFITNNLDAPFSESDQVTVRYESGMGFVGMIGGGFTYGVTAGSGLRLDMRAHFGPDARRTTVEASPSIAPSIPPVWLATFPEPSLQFTNNTPPVSASRSTLGGAPISDFVTFESNGWATRVALTAGWYLRF
jgi:hypothetical protein